MITRGLLVVLCTCKAHCSYTVHGRMIFLGLVLADTVLGLLDLLDDLDMPQCCQQPL